MRRFSFFRRDKTWYVQFYNPQTKKFTTAKSTGKTSRDETVIVAAQWLETGIPKGKQKELKQKEGLFTIEAILEGIRKASLSPTDAQRITDSLKEKGLIEAAIMKTEAGSQLLETFLLNFWEYDSSPYVEEKLAHGHSIGRRHVYELQVRTRKHWVGYFKGRRLGEIQKADLKGFSLFLAHKGLAAHSINTILSYGLIPLRWAFENGIIPVNPGQGLLSFQELRRNGES
jgi:hypothetical protein